MIQTITVNGFPGLNTFREPTKLRPGVARDMQDVFRSSVNATEGTVSAIQDRAGYVFDGTAAATHTATKGSRISDIFGYKLQSTQQKIVGGSFDQGRYDADSEDWTRRIWSYA